MLLCIIFILSNDTAEEKKKVRVKVDQAGMPFAVPRLQSKLAYIWTTLKISAAAPR